MGLFDFLKKPKLTEEQRQAKEFLSMLDTSTATFSGGDGMSPETAVVVKGVSMLSGPMAELNYLGKKYGKVNVDWVVESQGTRTNAQGKPLDVVRLKFKDGRKILFHFEISAFFEES